VRCPDPYAVVALDPSARCAAGILASQPVGQTDQLSFRSDSILVNIATSICLGKSVSALIACSAVTNIASCQDITCLFLPSIGSKPAATSPFIP
jgi:hypothetical protein